MLEGKLGRRYGKALFELAANREEAVAAELDNYLDTYIASEQILIVLEVFFCLAAGRGGFSDGVDHTFATLLEVIP